MKRQVPSRFYVWAGLSLWLLAALAGWGALRWPPAIFGMSVLLLASLVLVLLGLRPVRKRERKTGPAPRQTALPPVPPGCDEPKAIRYPLLRAEDEEEVERLYQKLKTVGRLDSTNSSDQT
ncbi:MAG: hypothetical protein IT159_11695 [Bryobacterales bacterium]|nr:hypothetical protein [Bryobacterales bacterium]